MLGTQGGELSWVFMGGGSQVLHPGGQILLWCGSAVCVPKSLSSMVEPLYCIASYVSGMIVNSRAVSTP